MSFPRVIHQFRKARELPPFIESCVSSIRTRHPDWDHRLYDEGGMEAVVSECGLITVEDFRRIPEDAGKADVFRCAVLFLMGGVFCDADMVAVRPLEEMFEEARDDGFVSGGEEVVMSVDRERLFGDGVLTNHFMVAMPQARFLGEYLREVGAAAREGRLGVDATGAGRLTRMMNARGGPAACGIGLVPPSWVDGRGYYLGRGGF